MSTLKYIIISLMISFLFTNVVYCQDSEEYVLSLYKKLNELDEEGNYNEIINTLIELHDADPDNAAAKRLFEIILFEYKTSIFSDERLLDDILFRIDDVSFIPVEKFITFYYNSNDQVKLNKILDKITNLDTSYLHLDDSFITELDPSINNQLYIKISQVIKAYSSTAANNNTIVDTLNKREQRLVEKLYAGLTNQNANNNYVGMINNLLAILEISPNDDNAKLVLGNVVSKFKEDILINKELVYKFLPYMDDYSNMPIDELLLFFYNSNDITNVNKLLTQIKTSDHQDFIVEPEFILSYDRRINPSLYDNILNILYSHVDLSSPAKNMIIFYQADLQIQLEKLLEDNSLQFEQNEIVLNELLSLDPEIDEGNFKLLFPKMLNIIPQTDVDTLQQTKALYQFAKQNYLSRIEEQVQKCFDKISSNIVPGIQRYDELLIWSISSLYKNQTYRANLFLDQIYAYGSEKDLKYLKQELTWWRDHGFAQNIIDPILEKYFNVPSPTTKLIARDDDLITESWFGEYYALVIGVEEYIDENVFDLNYPVSDANSLVEVLTKYYSFRKENVTFLKNPTRDKIIAKFYELRNTISENDNILVFYAGHGVWDKDIEQGYWLPQDAEYDEITNWLSNSEVRDLLKGIKAKHTLLIADACFSGSIFKTREPFLAPDKSVQETFKRISRQAITSGALKTVPDKSVFIEYLIKYLTKNSDQYLPAQKLYLEFKDAVINNSPNNQSPRFGVIYNAGDEGGDFIFIKK